LPPTLAEEEKTIRAQSNRADAALGSLPGAGTFAPTPAVRTSTDMDREAAKTDRTVAELRSYASSLEGRLPFTKDAATRKGVAIETAIRKSGVSDIEVNGEKRYGNEVAEIRRINAEAQKAAEKGDETRAKALFEEAEAKLSGLAEIILRERKLAAAGAPQAVMDGVKATFNDYGTPNQKRAERVNQAVDIFLENKDVLKTEQMQPVVENIFTLVTLLGKASAQRAAYTEKAEKTASEFIGKMTTGFANMKAERARVEAEEKQARRDVMLADTQRWSQEAAEMRTQPRVGKEYREALAQIKADADAMNARLKKGEEVKPEEYARLDARMKQAQRGDELLKKVDPSMREGASRILARGYDAQAEITGTDPQSKSKSDEAQFQFYLFSEYTRQGAGSAGRKQIEGWSKRVADGEDRQKILDEAGRAMGLDIAGKNNKRAVPEDDARAAATKIAGNLSAGNVTVESLQRGRMALTIIDEYNSRNVRALGPEAAGTARDIYGRALSGLASNLPLEYSDKQLELARSFIKPEPGSRHADTADSRRHDIEQVSIRAEQAARLGMVHTAVTGELAPGAKRQTALEAALAVTGNEAEAKKLAADYEKIGTDAESRGKAIKAMDGGVNCYLRMNQTYTAMRKAEEKAATQFGRNSDAASQFDISAVKINSTMSNIAGGEAPTEAQVRQVEATRILYFGRPDEVEKLLAQSPEDVPRVRATLGGAGNFSDLILSSRGTAHANILSLASMAEDSVAKGQSGFVMPLLLSAAALAKTKDSRDSFEIYERAMNLTSGKLGTEEATWLARTDLDRISAEDKAKDPAEKRQIRYMFDSAALLYRRKDLEGAEAMRAAGSNYASAIASDRNDPRAKAAIDFAYRLAGDVRKDKGFASHRARDIGFGEKDPKRWVPAEGAIPGVVGRALASNTTLSAALGEEKPSEADKGTIFGDILALPPEKRLAGLGLSTAIMGARIGKLEHERRTKALVGGDKRKEAAIDRTYRGQQAFHEAKAKKARGQGDEVEAERQEQEAARADGAAMRERMTEADGIYGQGLAALEEAFGLRMGALREPDEKKAKEAAAKADEVGGRGMMIINLAESDQTALGAMHGSIMTIRTNRRDSGRRQADSAAATYARVGRLAAGGTAPGKADEVAMDQANQDMGSAQMNFAEQKAIQQQAEQWRKKIAALGQRIEVQEKTFGKGRKGGPLTTSVGFGHNGRTAETKDERVAEAPGNAPMWLTSKTYRSVDSGTPLVNTDQRRKDLANARSAVAMEEFGAAGYWYGIASRGVQIDTYRVQTELQYRELIFGAQPDEQKRGTFNTQQWTSKSNKTATVGFDYVGLMGSLYAAEFNLTQGRVGDADTLTDGYADRLALGYQTQRSLNNKHREHRQFVDAQNMAQRAREFGRPDEKARAAEAAQDEEIKKKGGKVDETSKRAHRQTIDLVHRTGAPKNLADAADAKAKDAAERESESDASLDRLVDRGPAKMFEREDVPGLLNAYFMATGRYSRYERGATKDPDQALEEIKRDPEFLAKALEYQRKHPAPDDGSGRRSWRGSKDDLSYGEKDDRDALALAWSRSDQSAVRFGRFERGFEMGISALGESVSRFETVDRYEREHGYGGAGGWYIGLRHEAGKLLQVGLAISQDPEGTVRNIERGERIMLPRINLSLRQNDPNYMDARIDVGSDYSTIPGAIHSATERFEAQLQRFSVGTPATVNDNIARMERGEAPQWEWSQPNNIATVYTATVMARGHLWKDKDTGDYNTVNMTREESLALFGILNKPPYEENEVEGDKKRWGMGGTESVLQRYAEVGLELGMVWSTSERKAMYDDLDRYSGRLMNAIDGIMGGRARGEPLGAATLAQLAFDTEKDRKAAEGMYISHMRSGKSSESTARGFYAVGKLAGAGVLIASGAGSAVGIGFGVDALHSLSEDSRKAGGFGQLTTKQQVLGVSGVVLGFAGGALGEIAAVSDAAIVAGRASTVVEAFATGGRASMAVGRVMMVGGIGMAGVGVYDSYGAWKGGEMGTFEFIAGGAAGFVQAVAPVAMHAMPTRFATRLWSSNTTGARIFRGGMLLLTGETKGAMATADANARLVGFHKEYNRLPEASQTAFRAVEARVGVPLAGEMGSRVMGLMPMEAGPGGKPVPVEMTPAARERFVSDATGLTRSLPRVEALEAGAALVRSEGRISPEKAKELGLSPADAALFNKGGPLAGLTERNASPAITDYVVRENRATAFETASAEANTKVSPKAKARADELAEGYRAFMRGEPKPTMTEAEGQLFTRLSEGAPEEAARGLAAQAERDTAGPLGGLRDARAKAAATAARNQMLGEMGVEHVPGEGFSYTKGGVKFTQEHGQAASQIAVDAQGVLAKPLSERASAIRDLGLPLEQARAVEDLVSNPDFARAAAGNDRSAMMDTALSRAASIGDVPLSQEYVSSRVSVGAEARIRDAETPPGALRRLASGEEQRAKAFRKSAEENRAKAAEFPPESAESKRHLALADRQTKVALAHENDVAKLRGEAKRRGAANISELEDRIGTEVAEKEAKMLPGLKPDAIVVRSLQLMEAYELHVEGKLTPKDMQRLNITESDVTFITRMEDVPRSAMLEKFAGRASQEAIDKASITPEAFDKSMRQQESEIGKPEQMRAAAVERRAIADRWEGRYQEELADAYSLEQSKAPPDQISAALRRAGRAKRYAEGFRESARRLEEMAAPKAEEAQARRAVGAEGYTPKPAAKAGGKAEPPPLPAEARAGERAAAEQRAAQGPKPAEARAKGAPRLEGTISVEDSIAARMSDAGIVVTEKMRSDIGQGVRDLRAGKITLGDFWRSINEMMPPGELPASLRMERPFPSFPELGITIQSPEALNFFVGIAAESMPAAFSADAARGVPADSSVQIGFVSLDLRRQNFLNAIATDPKFRVIGDINIYEYFTKVVRDTPIEVNRRLSAEGIDAYVTSAAFGKSSDEAGFLIVARDPASRARARQILGEQVEISFKFEGSALDEATRGTSIRPYIEDIFAKKGRVGIGAAFVEVSAGEMAAMAKRGPGAINEFIDTMRRISDARIGESDWTRQAKGMPTTADLPATSLHFMSEEAMNRNTDYRTPEEKASPTSSPREWTKENERLAKQFTGRLEAINVEILGPGNASVRANDSVVVFTAELAARPGTPTHEALRKLAQKKGKMYGTVEEGRVGLSVSNMPSQGSGDEFLFIHRKAAEYAAKRYADAHGLKPSDLDVVQTGTGADFYFRVKGRAVSTQEAGEIFGYYREGARTVAGSEYDVSVRGTVLRGDSISFDSFRNGIRYVKDGVSYGDLRLPREGGVVDFGSIPANYTARDVNLNRAGQLLGRFFSSAEVALGDPVLAKKVRDVAGEGFIEGFRKYLSDNHIELRSWEDFRIAMERYPSNGKEVLRRLGGDEFLGWVEKRYQDATPQGAIDIIRRNSAEARLRRGGAEAESIAVPLEATTGRPAFDDSTPAPKKAPESRSARNEAAQAQRAPGEKESPAPKSQTAEVTPEQNRLAQSIANNPESITRLASGLATGNKSAEIVLGQLGNHPMRKVIEGVSKNPEFIEAIRKGDTATIRRFQSEVAASPLRFFTEAEFRALHPEPEGTQIYHNVKHTENTARAAHEIASARETTPQDAAVFGAQGTRAKKAGFVAEVAMAHDMDPTRTPGTPASVARTLEWMDSPQGQSILRTRFGWDDTKITMAKAMIARTDFPFSPAAEARYVGLLESLQKAGKGDAAAVVAREAPVLSEYADKSSWYYARLMPLHRSGD
jgi:hypothetical protein